MNSSVFSIMAFPVTSVTDPVVQPGLVTTSDTSEDWRKQRLYCSLDQTPNADLPVYSGPYKDVTEASFNNTVLVIFVILYCVVVILGIYYVCKKYRRGVQKRLLGDIESYTDPNRNIAKAPKGIKNLGNTCYMNSLLQVLSWTPQIRQRLALHVKECMKLQTSQSFNGISVALLDFVEEVHGSEARQVDDKKLKAILHEARKLNPQFVGQEQQDSFELFNTIIGGIDDELMTPASTGTDNDSNNSLTEEESPLTRLFTGMHLTVYKYQTCDHIDTTFQRFTSISVPVTKQKALLPSPVVSTKPTQKENTSFFQSNTSNEELIRNKSPEAIYDNVNQQTLLDHNSQIPTTNSVVIYITSENDPTHASVANASSAINIDSQAGQPGVFWKKKDAVYERQESDMDISDDETVHSEKCKQQIFYTGEELTQHYSMETETFSDRTREFINDHHSGSDTTVKDHDVPDTCGTMKEAVNAVHENRVQSMAKDSDALITPEGDKQKHQKRTDDSYLTERQESSYKTSVVSTPKDVSDHLTNGNVDRETNNCMHDNFSSIDTTQLKHEVPMAIPFSESFETIKVPSGCQTDLERGLQQMTDIEEYSEKEIGCNYCNTGENGKTQKKLMVISAPPVLLLQINKFQEEKGVLEKINRHVTFPKNLNLDVFCSSAMQIEDIDASAGSGEGVKYSLYGVVSHTGDLKSGHYTAYVQTHQNLSEFHDTFLTQEWKDPRKSQKTILDHLTKETQTRKEQIPQKYEQNINTESKQDMWFYINDFMVRECEISEVLSDKNASLLFYERKK